MEAASVGGVSVAEGVEAEVGAKETGGIVGRRARLAAPGAVCLVSLGWNWRGCPTGSVRVLPGQGSRLRWD